MEIKIEILTSAKSRIYFIQISNASSCMEEKHGEYSDFKQNNPVTHKQMPDIAGGKMIINEVTLDIEA